MGKTFRRKPKESSFAPDEEAFMPTSTGAKPSSPSTPQVQKRPPFPRMTPKHKVH